MKSIRVRLTGTTPIMFDNIQTVNPLNPYTKALKELTSKRNKTDEDCTELFHLHFLASWYYKDGHYIIPRNALMAGLVSAAKENKLGAKFTRSLAVMNDGILQFPHNHLTPEELWQDHAEEYVDIRAAGIMKAKIMATRAIVPKWSAEFEIVFDETQLNDGEVWNALNITGLRYGIGTYRQLYGRFSIEEIKQDKKKAKK